MKSSKDIFKKNMSNSFSKDIKLNKDTIGDANQQMGEFKENKKKRENKEATGSGSSGAYSGPLFTAKTNKKIETKEATTSGSVGAYETPAAWAKSMNKKEWRGKSKTQIPGGKFVSVKQRCKNFPYCNQGDIKSLDIYNNKRMKEAVKSVSEKLNINESYIKAMIEYELEQLKKKYD